MWPKYAITTFSAFLETLTVGIRINRHQLAVKRQKGNNVAFCKKKTFHIVAFSRAKYNPWKSLSLRDVLNSFWTTVIKILMGTMSFRGAFTQKKSSLGSLHDYGVLLLRFRSRNKCFIITPRIYFRSQYSSSLFYHSLFHDLVLSEE